MGLIWLWLRHDLAVLFEFLVPNVGYHTLAPIKRFVTLVAFAVSVALN